MMDVRRQNKVYWRVSVKGIVWTICTEMQKGLVESCSCPPLETRMKQQRKPQTAWTRHLDLGRCTTRKLHGELHSARHLSSGPLTSLRFVFKDQRQDNEAKTSDWIFTEVQL